MALYQFFLHMMANLPNWEQVDRVEGSERAVWHYDAGQLVAIFKDGKISVEVQSIGKVIFKAELFSEGGVDLFTYGFMNSI